MIRISLMRAGMSSENNARMKAMSSAWRRSIVTWLARNIVPLFVSVGRCWWISWATESGTGPAGRDSQEEAKSLLYNPLKPLTPFPCAKRFLFSRAACSYSSSSVCWSHRQSSHERQMSYSERDPRNEIEEYSFRAVEDMRIPWWQVPAVKCKKSEYRQYGWMINYLLDLPVERKCSMEKLDGVGCRMGARRFCRMIRILYSGIG